MSAAKIARFAVLTAMALILSFIDSLLPLDFIAPGVKLGLANTVLLYAVYLMRPRESVLLMVLKVTLSALLLGFSQFPYSLAGGIFSLAVMLTAYRFRFHSVTVSIAGSVAHNAGQLAMAAVITSTAILVVYLPVLILAGVLTGTATGLTAKYVLRALASGDARLSEKLVGTDIIAKPGN